MLQAYPQTDTAQLIDNAAADIEWVKNFIVAIRNIHDEMDIAPTKPLPMPMPMPMPHQPVPRSC